MAAASESHILQWVWRCFRTTSPAVTMPGDNSLITGHRDTWPAGGAAHNACHIFLPPCSEPAWVAMCDLQQGSLLSSPHATVPQVSKVLIPLGLTSFGLTTAGLEPGSGSSLA